MLAAEINYNQPKGLQFDPNPESWQQVEGISPTPEETEKGVYIYSYSEPQIGAFMKYSLNCNIDFDFDFDFDDYIIYYNKLKENYNDPLGDIEREIERSRYIPDLSRGWDYDGAEPIDEKIFTSTIEFLRNYVRHIYTYLGIVIHTPEINPCRDGTIDLSWRSVVESNGEILTARMLINIRKDTDSSQQAYFYGDLGGSNESIKGNTSTDKIRSDLAQWMATNLERTEHGV